MAREVLGFCGAKNCFLKMTVERDYWIVLDHLHWYTCCEYGLVPSIFHQTSHCAYSFLEAFPETLQKPRRILSHLCSRGGGLFGTLRSPLLNFFQCIHQADNPWVILGPWRRCFLTLFWIVLPDTYFFTACCMFIFLAVTCCQSVKMGRHVMPHLFFCFSDV